MIYFLLKVFINQKKIKTDNLSNYCALVLQQDVLLETLTPRGNIF